jgi:hypothetical protein
MMRRCYDPENASYAFYGGREDNPIMVCDRWRLGESGLLGVECFKTDMGVCPPRHTLERKNNDLGYFSENCYWALPKVQANNRRNNVHIMYRGETMTLAQAWEKSGRLVSRSTFHRRIADSNKWNAETALETPAKKRRSA